jgi:hypothetical protein
MFSNIIDAWDHDPVKEMTDKLSRGSFKSNPKSELFNFQNRNDQSDTLSLSDAKTISLRSPPAGGLLSDNTINSDLGSYAPANFNKYLNKQGKHDKPNKYAHNKHDNNISDSDTHSSNDSKCVYSIKHLKRCDRCHDKLKHLINSKVNKKFDEIILDNKMKQLQNMTPVTQPPIVYPQNTIHSDSWKETLIIVIGAIIAIFIIFLIVKSLHK